MVIQFQILDRLLDTGPENRPFSLECFDDRLLLVYANYLPRRS